MPEIKVLIADDIPNTREDIKRLLFFEEDITVVGEAGNGQEAVNLATSLQPDIVLMDINMPRLDGIQATEIIASQCPATAIIIISIQGEQEYLRRAMAAGAREYLVKPFSSNELAETIRRVNESTKKRLSLLAQAGSAGAQIKTRTGKIMAFFCTKGGTGKTTLACNLAVCLAQMSKKKVALVDLDLQGGDVSVMLNISARGSIADLAQEAEHLDTALLDSYLVPHISGVKILPAPASPEQAELVTLERVEELLRLLQESFDYILVDTSPIYSDINLAVLDAASQIFLIANQDLPCLRHVKISLEIFQTLGHSDKVRLIVNNSGSEGGIKLADLEKSLNLTAYGIIPADDKVIRSSINRGLPVVMAHPGSKSGEAMHSLAGRLDNSRAPADQAAPSPAPEPAAGKRSLIGRIFSF